MSAAVAALALALPVPAVAAPGWLAPVTLSTSGENAFTPELAVDPAGGAMAVWVESAGGNVVVAAANRRPGGSWPAAPTRVSGAGEEAVAPHVGVDAVGNATAVWIRRGSAGSPARVRTSLRPVGGVWPISPDSLGAADAAADSPRVAVGAGGVTAVWLQTDGDGNTRVWAGRRLGASVWLVDATPLSPAGRPAIDPQVALDASGNATAIWRQREGSEWLVQGAQRRVGEAWDVSGTTLSVEGASADSATLAVTPGGTAWVAWVRTVGATRRVQAVQRPPGGPWQFLPSTWPTPGRAESPQLASDAAGTVTAVWRQLESAVYRVAAGTLNPVTGQPAGTTVLSESGRTAEEPRVAVTPQGTPTAAWILSDGRVQATTRIATGTWPATPEDVAPAGTIPDVLRLAGDASGNVVATWRRAVGPHVRVQAAARDAAGPAISLFVVPGDAVAGTPFTVRTAATDAWSNPSTVTWDFGDGTTTPGITATHAYAAAGTFTVTMTATDALGNVTTRSQRITVAAPPSPFAPEVAPPAVPPPERPTEPAAAGAPRPGAIAPTGSAGGGGTPAPAGRPLPASAVSLPSAKRCLSRRTLTVTLRRLPGVRYGAARVVLRRAGTTVRRTVRPRTREGRTTLRVSLAGIPRGRVTVTLLVRTTDGRTVTVRRAYRTCAPARRR